jgi:murein DD-endopeptidase MepM/ murein hydrolase activator NlpD
MNGQQVRRGDVIGFVGTTGRSTSPHLHYEILMNGQQTNPLRLLAQR